MSRMNFLTLKRLARAIKVEKSKFKLPTLAILEIIEIANNEIFKFKKLFNGKNTIFYFILNIGKLYH